MPKYITYGDYDESQNTYTGDTEKEISGSSAEEILRGNETAAAENTPEEQDGEKKQGFYKKSTATEANSREEKSGKAAAAAISSQVTGAKGKSTGGRFAKRFAPLALIMGLIGFGAVGIGASQVMMPFHVIESLTEMTDGSFTARQARMPKLVRWMFNMEAETNNTRTVKNLFGGGTTTKYRKSITSKRVRNRLAAEGIDVETDDGLTVLKYHQPDGTVRTVTADEYTELWRTDSDFRNKMNRGGRSFLGRIAAHIDLTLANFLNSHNLTKNLFKDWINKVYDAEGQSVRLHNVIEARSPDTTGNVRAQESDYDGESKKPPLNVDADADAETLKANYGEMISNIASITTSAVCGAAAISSAVTAARVVIAYENARGAFSGIAEAVDKVKAGNGATSPINASADMMMKKDEDGRTMLQSESMKWALSGGIYTPDKNAEDVKSTDVDSMFRNGVISGVVTSASFIMGCAVANIATAAVSVIVDIATLGTFSVGKLVIGAAIGVGATVAITALTNTLVENAKTNFCLDASGPKAGACMYLGAAKYNGQNFQAGGGTPATKEKAEEFYDAYKVALTDEAELIRSTKSPFDVSSSHTFLGSIVSKLGFLSLEMPSLSGFASSLTSLARASITSLLPSASATEKFSYFSNQLRDDCLNLQLGDIQVLGDLNCEPVFVTDQTANAKIDPEEAFVKLAEYTSFNDKTKTYETQFLQNSDGTLVLDENGNEQINPDSDLGKYISYCGYRASPFGQIDQNIMNAESQTTENSTLGAILNAIPILGNLLQMYEAGNQIATVGWSSGANCVARNDGADSKMNIANLDTNGEVANGAVPVTIKSWNDFMRYAQIYVTDDRFMQTSYENYISPVQTFAEKQGLVESDDKLSFVEYLAKYTGYTKENIQIALNELEYWTYVAQYEPEGKGPMVFEEPTEIYDFELPDHEIYEDYDAQIASVRQYVVYADLRNRYSAVA